MTATTALAVACVILALALCFMVAACLALAFILYVNVMDDLTTFRKSCPVPPQKAMNGVVAPKLQPKRI